MNEFWIKKIDKFLHSITKRLLYNVIEDIHNTNLIPTLEPKRQEIDLLLPCGEYDYTHTQHLPDGRIVTHHFTKNFPPIFSCKLKNVKVLIESGACIAEDKFLYQQSIAQPIFFYKTLLRRKFKFEKYVTYTETALVFIENKNPWHFFMDDFGYALLLSKKFKFHNLIIRKGAAPYANDILKLIFPNINVINSKDNLRMEKHIFATKPINGDFANPGLVSIIRNSVLTKIKPISNFNSKLIYISRSQARLRSVAGEKEFEKFIESIGGEVIFLEQLDFSEQVNKLRNARQIIGLHGAGLTHMMWAKSSCIIVEIFPTQTLNNCYLSLANACGHSYNSFHCDLDSQNPWGKIPFKNLERFLNKLN